MPFKPIIEEQIQRGERKLKELSISLQRLDEQYQELLNALESTPDQLKEFAENSDNYSPEEWEQLQNEKKKWDEDLQKQLDNIRDEVKAKKNLSEKGAIQQHWLFVR